MKRNYMDKFDEFAENEVLFEYWWNFLCYERKIFGDAYFIELWANSKNIAIGVLGSKKARLTFRREIHLLRSYYDDTFCGFDVKSFNAALCCATTMIIISSKKDEVDYILEEFDKVYHLQENEIAIYAADLINSIEAGEIKKDYDYSKVDGGIKDETETDETETITITKTDETITKTITKTDGSVELPDVLDTNEFKKYLSLAKEKGLIKDVNGKLEWIQIGNRGGSSQLAYFLGRAFGYIHSENGNIGNEFPDNELDELFGVKRIYRRLVQVHEALKPQKWRRKIDELFE